MQNLRGKKMQETKTKKALLSIKNFFIKLWNYYTLYEKIWFLSITILAFVFAFVFPEEDIGGVNGKVIMALYLLNIFTNILCELLISKQSKWNFLVSLIVEASEIAILIICSFRFATMAATIFFWIPIDIISFFVWHKHPDKNPLQQNCSHRAEREFSCRMMSVLNYSFCCPPSEIIRQLPLL